VNRLERTLLVAIAGLLGVGGGATAIVLAGRRPSNGPTPGEIAPSVPAAGSTPPSTASGGPGLPSAGGPSAGEPTGRLGLPASGRGVPTRTPEGIDLSDPAVVKGLLREYLVLEDPPWDQVAKLLGVLAGRLDDDIREHLQRELVRGNAAGAIQAYAQVRDGTVVPELLRLLDDPETDAHDRGNVLHALASIPSSDEAVLVTGIESRLDGDPDHDRPYLAAIARRGGAEGARALVQALARAPDPARFPPETFRDLDLRRSPGANEVLAAALADPAASPGARRAVAELAGRPGASPAVVDALAALDTEGQDRLVRTQVLLSLAATGDDRAIGRLLDLASKGADFGSVAARALADVSAASVPARDRMLAAARDTKDENLRTNLVTALGNVKEKRAVPMFVEAIEKGSKPTQREAVVAVGRLGAEGNSAVEALGSAFTTGNEGLRSEVAIALANIGTPEARRKLEALAVAESDPRVKKAIQASLRRLEALRNS
jgi:HEAT repeat protein